MPPLKRLTADGVRKIVRSLGESKATWALIAQRTGHATSAVREFGEAHGIFLATVAPGDEGRRPQEGPGLLSLGGLIGEEEDLSWDPLSGKLPRIPHRVWDGLVTEWYKKNRDDGDLTPLDVLFRDHRACPRLEKEAASLREQVRRFEADGRFKAGSDEGYQRGLREGDEKGYDRGRADWVSKVEVLCAACDRTLVVNLDKVDGRKTFFRGMFDLFFPSDQIKEWSLVHVDCNQPGLGGGMVYHPDGLRHWVLITDWNDNIRLDDPAWLERFALAEERFRSQFKSLASPMRDEERLRG